jgi:hypothetical protein
MNETTAQTITSSGPSRIPNAGADHPVEFITPFAGVLPAVRIPDGPGILPSVTCHMYERAVSLARERCEREGAGMLRDDVRGVP